MNKGTFAKTTKVSSTKSREEIEKTLTRYGATSFLYGWESNVALIAFEMNNRRLKFKLSLPERKEFFYTHTQRRKRSETAVDAAYEQAVRQRWRALALVIKAKLESVEVGITIFEEEFLAHIVLPDGRSTVSDFMIPQIESAYRTGTMPAMLPSGKTPPLPPEI